jgi:hypothetical protein
METRRKASYQEVDDIEAPIVELFAKDFSKHNGQRLDNGVQEEKQKEEITKVMLSF